MTGFRVASAGAQELYGIEPDLTTLGKVIGGGLPVGAFGGRAEIMARIAPAGDVYQAGTLSGNPLAVTAGLATLSALDASGYAALGEATAYLAQGLRDAAAAAGVPVVVNNVCGMFGLFLTDAERVESFDDVAACDIDGFNRFFHHMLAQGVYLAPSAFEAGFVSLAHDRIALDATLAAAARSFEQIAGGANG